MKNKKDSSVYLLCGIGIILIIVIVILSIAIMSKKPENKQEDDQTPSVDEPVYNEPDSSLDYDLSMFSVINVDEFCDLFSQRDHKTYFVLFGQKLCGHCQNFIPIVQQSLEEYDYNMYYLDGSNLSSKDFVKLMQLDDLIRENIGYTPKVFVVRDGQARDVNDGDLEYATYCDFLIKNGVQKEK